MNSIKSTELSFESGGVPCAATVYRPSAANGPNGLVPCVVMGHGTSGTQDLGLATYAERFAAAGMAVLTFDYRHFGASGGQPRQVINIAQQLEDYRAAIHCARSLPGVDPSRIALWGTSLSGGHVLAIAATNPRIAAVVSQVPFVGVEFGRASPRSGQATRRLLVAAFRDVIRAILGRAPYLIYAVGHPGEEAAFTDPDARAWMEQLAPAAPTWRNAFAARVLFSMLWYRPGANARNLTMPLLMCIANQDTASSTTLALRAAAQAQHVELRRYPLTHFAAYVGEGFELMVADEVRFLRTRLLASQRKPSTVAQGGCPI